MIKNPNNSISREELLDLVYPVGSVYISFNNTSPENFLGGTWTQIQDRFLLAASSTYPAGFNGGNANHSHTLNNGRADIIFDGGYLYIRYTDEGFNANSWTSIASGTINNWTTKNSVLLHGSTDSSNNMPPYVGVYMWRRTA